MALLANDEIHVWLMRRPSTRDASLHILTTADEQQRANGMISQRRQCEWLAGRALLRQCLGYYTGCDGLELMFNKTEAGKPFLDQPDTPAFNLSHGPGWIACVVADAENIGIDIDSEARRNRTEDIAARYFHDLEKAAMSAADSNEIRQQFFFRQWTLKEAYIKALGETINSMRLEELVFVCKSGETPRAEFSLTSDRWQFQHWRFDEHHHLALACERSRCDTGHTDNLRYRFWLWDAATQSRHELTDEWPCTP